ncbi:hypothetical protein Rhopal_002467-T1 [Rhodotorula paludigena]|uniref:Non-specific serine/threonine protein kinase n=1 Tax=Rhodotorula paludigena TaxID=86838 RepID=A0AAV5GAP1_9BASI|nr:hypothetical protein Rhopal_002467-T1 [Rhodotorula paludigena]
MSSTREPSPADAPYFGTISHLVNATESFARLRADLERQCAQLRCWHAALEMPAMPLQPPQMGATEDDVSAYLRRTLLERAAWFVQGVSGIFTLVGSPFPPMLVTPSDIGISTFDDPFLATEIASKTTRSLPRRVLFLLKIWCYEKRQFLMLRERPDRIPMKPAPALVPRVAAATSTSPATAIDLCGSTPVRQAPAGDTASRSAGSIASAPARLVASAPATGAHILRPAARPSETLELGDIIQPSIVLQNPLETIGPDGAQLVKILQQLGAQAGARREMLRERSGGASAQRPHGVMDDFRFTALVSPHCGVPIIIHNGTLFAGPLCNLSTLTKFLAIMQLVQSPGQVFELRAWKEEESWMRDVATENQLQSSAHISPTAPSPAVDSAAPSQATRSPAPATHAGTAADVLPPVFAPTPDLFDPRIAKHSAVSEGTAAASLPAKPVVRADTLLEDPTGTYRLSPPSPKLDGCDKLIATSRLGSGGSGVVFADSTGQYAIKLVVQEPDEDEDDFDLRMDEIENEIEIYLAIEDTKVGPGFVGAFEGDDFDGYILVTNKVDGRAGEQWSDFSSLGFVHGDVRPQNIVVSTAGPVLVDFGRCRLASEEERADEREALEELLDVAINASGLQHPDAGSR